MRDVPLAGRREALRQLFEQHEDGIVRFSQSFDVLPGHLLEAACRMGLEGVIVKRADAPYTSGRTETWLKLKCTHRQEFVVVGFTDRTGAVDTDFHGAILAFGLLWRPADGARPPGAS